MPRTNCHLALELHGHAAGVDAEEPAPYAKVRLRGRSLDPGAASSKTSRTERPEAQRHIVRPRTGREANRSASHRRAVDVGCVAAESSRLPPCQRHQKKRRVTATDTGSLCAHQGSKRQRRRQEEDTSPGPYGPAAQKTKKAPRTCLNQLPAAAETGLLDGTRQLNRLSLLNPMRHSKRRRSRTAARWREVTLRKLRRQAKHRD